MYTLKINKLVGFDNYFVTLEGKWWVRHVYTYNQQAGGWDTIVNMMQPVAQITKLSVRTSP